MTWPGRVESWPWSHRMATVSARLARCTLRATLVCSELPRVQHSVRVLTQRPANHHIHILPDRADRSYAPIRAGNRLIIIFIQRYHRPAILPTTSPKDFPIKPLMCLNGLNMVDQVSTVSKSSSVSRDQSNASWTNFSIAIVEIIWPDNPKLWLLWCYCESHANSIIWTKCLEESKPNLCDSMRTRSFPQVSLYNVNLPFHYSQVISLSPLVRPTMDDLIKSSSWIWSRTLDRYQCCAGQRTRRDTNCLAGDLRETPKRTQFWLPVAAWVQRSWGKLHLVHCTYSNYSTVHSFNKSINNSECNLVRWKLYHTCDRTERREISWIKIVWKYAALMEYDLELITEMVWFASIAPNGMIWIPLLILRDPLHINYSIIELNYYLTGDSKGSISSSWKLTSCGKIAEWVKLHNACLQSACHISWHQLSFWESQAEFL